MKDKKLKTVFYCSVALLVLLLATLFVLIGACVFTDVAVSRIGVGMLATFACASLPMRIVAIFVGDQDDE